MTGKQRKNLYRIIIGAVLYAAVLISARFIHNGYVLPVLFFVPYFIVAYDVVFKAARNIINGQVFDENFLMTVASFAAFALGEYSEAVAVMLFYQVGEFFQGYAVGKSRKSISDMMDIVPEYVNLEENGVIVQKDPDDIPVGTEIIIKVGEKIPIDGIVSEGESFVDTAALTGESVPQSVSVGSEVFSGCLNGSGTLKVRTTKAFEDSTAAKILELVENAASKKAKIENFTTHFARIYTPVVTGCAVLLALIPSFITGDWGEWIKRACIFLVISCPCALVISVPLGFFGGIGAASRIGVLVKGSNFLEACSYIKTVVFDKTGTLTKGEFKVTDIIPNGVEAAELLELAALAEAYSNHPAAVSVRAAYGKDVATDRVAEACEAAGQGVSAVVDGKAVLVGNEKLMEENGITFNKADNIGTVMYVACEGVFMGTVVIADEIKDDAKAAISALKSEGVKKCVMLSGDRQSVADAVGRTLGIDEVYAHLMPADKVELVEEMLDQKGAKDKIAFVGDGVNDAPVLSIADIGIAMGTMGSDAAIEAADIVIMDDDLSKIAKTVKIAVKTVKIIRQNIILALGVKAVVLVLGTLGIANMWLAVVADVGVAVVAILNSMRTLNMHLL
ncbi:MAG: cadmium-translocating P-type ATPase [Clostridia bacterium]|nr:cadmium-translocating P-type ATPase [Clostridia bacterium]